MAVFRASQVGRLMAYPDKDKLPDGALTYIHELASQILLDWQPEFCGDEMQKGIQCEDESIELINQVKGKEYKKNTNRITTDLLTGEWDVEDEAESLIIDVKTAYSKKTFPLVMKEGDKKLYEWQLRAYMHLRGLEQASIIYTLVDTPLELIKNWDNPGWHVVSHLPPAYRLTELNIKRDMEKEEMLLNRCKLAKAKLDEVLESKGYIKF